MKNTIAQRIYDFLKDFPPFNALEEEQLMTICEQVKIGYYEVDDYIFEKDEGLHDAFYVVKDGAVGIFREGNVLVDECDEGDIFGLRALIRQSDYRLSAKAIEESIVYAISSGLLEKYITSNIDASKFIMASFASNNLNPHLDREKGRLYSLEGEFSQQTDHLVYIQTVTYRKTPVICQEDTQIEAAARTMTEKKVGSIIITKDSLPKGIITDKDLRTKIATGKFSISDKVLQIMSSPVITVSENISIAEAQITMLRNKITHLCITKDGTMDSKLVGVLSEHDLVVSQSNNPSFLIKEVKRALTAENLRDVRHKAQDLMQRYLDQHIPVSFVSKIISAINEAITEKVIELSLDEMNAQPPTTFAWFSLGSQGREEQLLLTDQDNAIVFTDVPAEKYDETKSHFLKLARMVTEKLNVVGFEFCPAEMMADNPKWCLSLSEWKDQFKDWITRPDEDKIMLSTIFFDYDCVYGDAHLVDQMSESIFQSIERYGIFLNFLALNAIKNPPPLSFFRQFLVEHSGEHKDLFDIKARAMMPLVDAARLLVLSQNIKDHNNTLKRFEKLSELEPQNKELYSACMDAFKILLRFRTVEGLKHNDSGRFIDLKSLSKSNRLKLKGCFGSIKDIQELIKVRFNLAQLM
jgi:CBS domain-containing protein